MNMWRVDRYFSVALAVLAAACTGSAARETGEGAPAFRAGAIEAHMRYLADDLLEGREAGTRGYDLAAAYVAAHFRSIGLRPGGPDGAFLQRVPLQAQWTVREGARMTVTREGRLPIRLTLGDDYVVASLARHAASEVNAPAVFVGYGIDAPPFGHSDYAGLDVSGKIAVYLAGYPTSFPSEEGAHYGSTREKQRTAAAHGAIATVSIYTKRYETVTPWDRVRAGVDSMGMTWIAPDGAPFDAAPELRVRAALSPAGGAVLFDGAAQSYEQVRAEAETGAPKGFPLAVSLQIAQQSRHERRESVNVAAILEGGDPALKDEYVVMLGHLDHEGIGPAVKGDRIYNGALDNAAGIAALLEAARALASQPQRPRRSVLFLAVTAEEKGLLGSEYFALNPTVPRGSMVAAVNLDMPVLLYDFTDVIAFGAHHSTLEGVVAGALKETNLTVTPDPMPEQALFTRSDHYRFVEQGVPSIFLSTGWNSAAGPGEGGRVFRQFLAENYHRPSDDLAQPIDFQAGAKFARVNYLILRTIADADRRPAWNDGDFFGRLYGGAADGARAGIDGTAAPSR